MFAVAVAAAMYQEQVLSYKHLDEPLDEVREPPSLPCGVDLFHVPRHSGLYSGLTFFLDILCSLLQNKPFIPAT